MIKRILLASCAALTLGLLAGCGGGGAGGATGSSGPLTPTQRAAAMGAVTTYYGTLPHTDPASDNVAIAAFLKARPEFEASGVASNGSVWGRFTDGRMFVFANNRPTEQAGQQIRTAARAAQGGHRAIPTSTKAYTLHCMGTGYGNVTNEIAGELGSAGYNLVAGIGALSVLKNMTQAGVLYIDTHGGTCERRDGRQVYALGTSDERTDEEDAAFSEDLDAGRLVYFEAPWTKDADGLWWVHSVHYGITPDFVRKYVSLTPNSLAYIDACGSYDQDMISAFEAKGATTYFGWTDIVRDFDACQTAPYFFDCALGTNRVAPVQDPKQRPFDIATVYKALKDRSLGLSYFDAQHITELKYATTDDPATVDLLAPTIIRLQPEEEKDTLHIAGSFGPNPGSNGKVTVDGVELKVQSWQKDLISCDLPLNDDDAEGSSGPVLVEVRGHKSNAVELSSWRPTFRFTYHGLGTIQYTVTIHAHIRIDAHDYRLVPGETPRQGEWPFTLAKDSTCTIAVSGSYTEPNTGTLFVCDRSGSESIPLNGDSTRSFDGGGTVKTDVAGGVRTMRIQLHANAKDALRTTAHLPDGTTMVSYDEIQCDTASMDTGTDASIPIALTDSYGIIGDVYTFGPLDLEFDSAPAVNPPDPTAARGAVQKALRRR